MKHSKKWGQALAFVQKHHKGQLRAGNQPVWHHLLRVSSIVEKAMEEAGEGTAKERAMIGIAALGHDLLEDTKTTPKEIGAIFGKEALIYIEGMTNTWGDADVRPYVKKMSKESDAVRLIKLADLYDNTSNVGYTLTLLGKKWTTGTFRPIVDPMWHMIQNSRFSKYPKTAALLIGMNRSAFARLDTLLSEMKKGRP